MSIITLTTDLGLRDHYTASLKGALLSQVPDSQLVDISHEISQFNILEAAFVLKSAYRNFPPGTIHLIVVDPEGGSSQGGIVMRYKEQYFVGPNNGIMSLIKETDSADCVSISNPALAELTGSKSFMAHKMYAPTVAFLAKGGSFKQVGEVIDMRELIWGEPTFSGNSLRGLIIHIDHFGNAITNIKKAEFLKLKEEKSFQIFIRNVRLQRIVSTYSDVARGEALAIFSNNEHLEIALREGSAEKLLGLNIQDLLTIEFYG